MTGFARASVSIGTVSVIVEIRSVNNRYLDLHFRCPESLRNQEPTWRRKVAEVVSRGKVEIAIRVTHEHADSALTPSTAGLGSLKAALDVIETTFPDAPKPTSLDLLLAPGVLATEQVDDKLLAGTVTEVLTTALIELVEQRQSEGAKLAQLIFQRTQSMSQMLDELRNSLPLLREQQRQRTIDRIAQLGLEGSHTPDEKRLEEELVYLAQRTDVDEEMDRLEAHLEAINQALSNSKPCGRRLDFLMQELNREANTLSSKSTALNTTNTAVEFKVLIEQMREQIQNIE
jgi:uncharacterized protein (TIGR00255 family)